MIWRLFRPRQTNIVVQLEADEATRSYLSAIECAIRRLDRKAEKIMATEAEFNARLAAIEAATANVAAELQSLRDSLVNVGLTAEQESSVLASLDAKIAALQALSTPPPAPTPEPVPE